MTAGNSPFHPDQQNSRSEAMVTVALERISEAFRVMLWQKARENGLSPVQMQVLVFIAHHPIEQCTVSYLATEFNMTGATVSDSVRILVAKGLLERQSSPTDSRSHLLALTEKGKPVAEQSGAFADELTASILSLPRTTIDSLQAGLFDIIGQLNRRGLVNVQRMCLNCRFHSTDSPTGYYCRLLEKALDVKQLRLDCPEHLVR